MSDLKTFLSTHKYSDDFSILSEDKYVTQLEKHMKLNNNITLIWGGPLIYQVEYTGFCILKDYLYSSHISHSCFTKIKYNSITYIQSSLRPLSTYLVDLEKNLNEKKQLNNWSDYELGKYQVTMKQINAQKVRTITYNNLTIHLLSISDSIFYLDQILEYKYKKNILKTRLGKKTLEHEVLDYYNKKFNNKPSFSIVQSPSGDPYIPTPSPSPHPAPGPSPHPAPGPSRLRLVTYVDSRGISWQKPPLVNAGPTEYTDIICAFFLPSSGSGTDFAQIVLNPNPAYGGKAWIDLMHKADKRVMVSSGGATDLPTSASYFTTHEPVALAKNIADQIKAVGIDGIDIDWEDDWSNSNPGLTGYGVPTTRSIGSGPAVQWLITLTNNLRMQLPKYRYTITHAPQAPYFNIGYTNVWQKCGDSIDWLNIQFYNQGPYYTDINSLVNCNVMPINPASANLCKTWNGSIKDINCSSSLSPPNCVGCTSSSSSSCNYLIPVYKIIVGKPIKTGDGNSGIVAPDVFQKLLKAAVAEFPNLGGAMGWQWGSDMDGSWIKTLKTAFHIGPTPPPSPTPPTPAPTPPPPTPIPPTPPPTPVPGPSPSKVCHSINPQKASDSWCITNCNHIPPSCPSGLCKCN